MSQKKEGRKKKKGYLPAGLILGTLGVASAAAGAIIYVTHEQPKPVEYITITFDGNGGTLDGTKLKVTPGTSWGSIAIPRIKTFPQFKLPDGWENSSGHKMQPNDILSTTQTIKARWLDSGVNEIKFVNHGDDSITWSGKTTVSIGDGNLFGTVNKPVAHKPNEGDKVYRFIGWKNAANDADITSKTPITDSIEVYPVFDGRQDVEFINITFSVLDSEPDRPDIEFKFNEVSGRTFSIDIDEDLKWSEINKPIATKVESTEVEEGQIVKTEYDFDGWWILNGAQLEEIGDTHKFSDGDIIYAKFADAPASLDSSYYVKDQQGNIGKIINGTESSGDILIMHKNASGEVVVDDPIPRENFNQRVYFGKKVTSITPNFLRGCTSFNQYVEIPESVTYIGSGFLYGCTAYNNGQGYTGRDLIIPDTIASIGKCFLYNCVNFNRKLTLNTTLYTIDDYFLTGCETFAQQIVLPSTLVSIGNSFMSYCKAFNNDSKAFSIPTGLTYLGSDFMSSCSQFRQNLDFGSCTGLTEFPSSFLYEVSGYNGSVILPVETTSIGTNFCAWTDGNPNLSANFGSNPTYPLANLKTIGSAFLNKTNYAPTHKFNLASCQNLISIGDNFMRNDGSIGSYGISLPASLQTIGDHFMYGCTNFSMDGEAFILPENIKHIGDDFMFICGEFDATSFALPTNVESIGNQFMYQCSSFSPTTFTFGSKLQSIGNDFMYGCTSFNASDIVLPNTLTTIGDNFMYACSYLNPTSFIMSNAMQTIGNNFLYGCSRMAKSFTIPATVTHVGGGFIYAAYSIPSLTINCSSGAFVESDYSFTQIYTNGDELLIYGSVDFNSLRSKFGPITATMRTYGRNLVKGS